MQIIFAQISGILYFCCPNLRTQLYWTSIHRVVTHALLLLFALGPKAFYFLSCPNATPLLPKFFADVHCFLLKLHASFNESIEQHLISVKALRNLSGNNSNACF